MDTALDEPVGYRPQSAGNAERPVTVLLQATREEDRRRTRQALGTFVTPVQIVEICHEDRLRPLLRNRSPRRLPDLVIAESPPERVWPSAAEPGPKTEERAAAATRPEIEAPLWVLLDTSGEWLGKPMPFGVTSCFSPARCGSDDWLRLTEHLAAEFDRRQLARRAAEQQSENSLLRRELEGSGARSDLASRTRDSFLASINHELRTPLSAILNLSESLLEALYGPLNPEQVRSIGLIEDNSRHLLAMINDILDLTKLEGGKLDLELAPVDLEEICLAALAHVSPAATEKRLGVSRHLGLGGHVVLGDYRRLQQILIRLLGNAIKFTPTGGEIGLDLAPAPEGREARLAVWDSGIGIEPAQQALLFQNFAQLDSGLDRKYVGTGLGLSLAAQMAQLHGGRIRVESAGKDQGSRFTLLLPIHDAPRMPGSGPGDREATQGRSAPGPRAPLVLIAEDNETVTATVQAYLEAKGFRICIADNGIDAVKQCLRARPDLVLMDMKMPGMNGLDAIRAIREDLGDEAPPIIGLTGLDLPGEQQRCIDAGADTYLRKPIRLKDLTARIEEILAAPPRRQREMVR